MPCRELRMRVPPRILWEAEIQVRQRAADRDVADRKWRLLELPGLLLQRSDGRSALDRVGRKVRLGLLRGRAGQLVPPQQQKIQHAIAERLPAQRLKPLRHGRGDELRPV